MENQEVARLVRLSARWKYPYAELATGDDLANIAYLGGISFGAHAFSLEKFKSLFAVNRNIIYKVVGKGTTKGYVDIWPVSEDFGNSLIAGAKEEGDVRPSDLYQEDQLRDAPGGFIYIAALVVGSALTTKAQQRGVESTFAKLSLATFDRVQQIHLQNPKFCKVLYMANIRPDGTPGLGATYLDKFRFHKEGISRDGCPVYLLDLHKEDVRFADLFVEIAKSREKASVTGPRPSFISYSRDDREFALRLASELKAADANVWMDELDIEPGERWPTVVQSALRDATRVLVILSPASARSPNVGDEIATAIEKGKKVIPILYRDCEIPLRLKELQYVDFRADYDAALKRLLKILAPAAGPR